LKLFAKKRLEAMMPDIIVPYTEHVLPMIPAGKSVKEMLLK
jgi:hypothetical protein